MTTYTPNIPAEHLPFLERATRITTPLVTYLAVPDGSKPLRRGTGFFLKHDGRHFVVTNSHVLEQYAAGRAEKRDIRIQVWSGEGEDGSEFHGGYLLTPNTVTSTILGAPSNYDHRDVGLIELTGGAAMLASRQRDFVLSSELDSNVPKPGDVVFYKGYPKKSAEFHAPIRKALFGRWFDIRAIDQVSDRLLITTDKPLAIYRSNDFPEEDGKDLEGISGSALLAPSGRVVGVVWGGPDGSADSPIWAVPSRIVLEMLDHYLRLQPASGAVKSPPAKAAPRSKKAPKPKKKSRP